VRALLFATSFAAPVPSVSVFAPSASSAVPWLTWETGMQFVTAGLASSRRAVSPWLGAGCRFSLISIVVAFPLGIYR
jgi:hypothetical protein